ncbi:MAG: decaprenylphospho-beta-D-erythro-pentofuranosid-2-ulose 2-reductase [Actinomycetota bacterium]|nr:decaprenylphospho-beta-D-erythro-pentofuranosid-2-ulose 2-reductase [Actinomycetota bacterium]
MMDSVGTPQSVLLLGGTSDIGLAVVERLGTDKPLRVVLAGRPGPKADAAAQRLRDGGHDVRTVAFDAEDVDRHPEAMAEAFSNGDIDLAVVAFGVLGDQEQAWQHHTAALRLATVNYTAAVSTGVLVADRFRAQGHGTFVLLSSVAGERPRRSNFVYGSSKAGADAFFTGLREALRPQGMRVVVVRPGFVRSAMTAGMKSAPLAVDPGNVADAVIRALRTRQDVVWVPPKIRWVMVVLRHLPAPIFRRLPI